MESAVDRPEGKPLGRILSEERERQGLSRAEAAQRLHMSPMQVEALESDDYARLPQGTFLRGFVRNYSRFLGLDADAMLARLAEAAPPVPSPGIVVPSQNIRFDPLGGRLASPFVKAVAVGAVALALAFAAIYWWIFIRAQPPLDVVRDKPAREAGPPQQIASAPVPAPDPSPSTPAPVAIEPAPPEPPKAEPRLEPPKAEPPAAAPVQAEPGRVPARGERVIKLRFRGESWVEIRDGQGRVLLSRLNAPGSEAEVIGRPPFQVIVGNAPEVSMTYNDRDFPLEPHTKVAVARFTLE